jgi:hypothetical protein
MRGGVRVKSVGAIGQSKAQPSCLQHSIRPNGTAPEGEVAMARSGSRDGPRGGEPIGRERGDRSREPRHEREEREPWDDPKEHHRVEKQRFAGGLPATPEQYALAREQWNRLPGAVVRPSMNSGLGSPTLIEPRQPDEAPPSEKGPEQ